MGKTQKPVEALGPGEIGVVAKLKDTLTGDTLSRRGQSGDPARHLVPGARHLLRHPAEDPRRRGQDLDGAPPHGGRGSDAAPPLRPGDQAAPRLGHRPAPRRGRGGADEAQVQRGRVAPAAAHSLQGDGQGARGGAGQVQEADGRARPVRRHVAQDRAARARRRLRVRGRHLRRRHPAQLHPVGGKGRARLHEARHPRRLPRRRPPGHALRRLVPRRGLVRHGVSDRRVDGAAEGLHGGAAVSCSSRS